MATRRLLQSAGLVAMLVVSAAAQASLIVNGNFETGDLSGWTTFTTSNGTTGSPAVVLFDTTGTGSTYAARFNVGKSNSNGANGGGGIFQNFAFSGGTIEISVDIASQDQGVDANAAGGHFKLLLDGATVDSVNFASIDAGATERDSLQFQGPLAAGSHELRIEITRAFTTSAETPFQFLDNVAVAAAAAATAATVPEPGTFALLGLGLAGLAATRRRKQ